MVGRRTQLGAGLVGKVAASLATSHGYNRLSELARQARRWGLPESQVWAGNKGFWVRLEAIGHPNPGCWALQITTGLAARPVGLKLLWLVPRTR